MLRQLERKVLWLSSYMIHHANHEVDRGDGLKVGGHQASSASLVTLMTALYFHVLRPEDRVAVKPHASPVFHAIQYLLGNQDLDKLQNFRAFGGAQSYPSRTKDTGDVDFSTGSVGLGVASTGFASLVQDYVHAKGWSPNWPKGRMIALMGDAEIDEGNVHEALLEYWKHGLENCWWVIDYNRQSLDSVVSDRLFMKVAGAVREPRLEGRPHQVRQAAAGGVRRARRPAPARSGSTTAPTCSTRRSCSRAARRGGGSSKRTWPIHPDTLAIVRRHDDAELARLMTNLGGHDMEAILEAFEGAPTGQPVCFIAYTIKGYGLPFQGHKDNHSGLMTKAQMQRAARARGHQPGRGMGEARRAGAAAGRGRAASCSACRSCRRAGGGWRRPRIPVDPFPKIEAKGQMSTQAGFGRVLDEIARAGGPLADRIVTTSPDVTVSTNLGPWVNRRGLFSMASQEDLFRERGLMSPQRWVMSPKGQHIELGIAEMNLFLTLSALGLSHALFGERLLPVGTLYDPFVCRGLDALNYACYQDSRFMVVGTPAGITLAPEGGAHQSIGTPLIGMAQDGLATFEPAYVDELAVIMEWAFDYMQRDGSEDNEQRWHRDEKGGSVYLRLSTRPLDQPARPMTPSLRDEIIEGGYWLRRPEPGTSTAIVYTGAVAPEAIEAAGLLAEDRRGVGVLAVTSADRLSAGWHAAQRAREHGERDARAHVEDLLSALPRDAAIVTVTDAYPEALSWLGGVLRPSRAGAGRGALRPVGLAQRALRPLRPRRERHPGGGRRHGRPPVRYRFLQK